MNCPLSCPSFLIKILLFIFVILFSSLPSYALTVKADPEIVMPGDVFVIRLSGIADRVSPEAVVDGRDIIFSSCGNRCFIGIGAFDINARPGKRHIRIAAGKTKMSVAVVVKPARFPVLHLTLPEEKVVPGPDDLKRIKEEETLLTAIWQKKSDKLWNGNFLKPLDSEFSTQFGTKRIMNEKTESIHRGLDIRGAEGDPVRAVNSGRVVLTKELFFGGNTLIIDHGQGIYSLYMHLSAFRAKEGDMIFKGDTIGLVGSTGRASGPHLHFGIKFEGINVNPVSFFTLRLPEQSI